MGQGDVEFLREVYEEWGQGDYSRQFFADDIVSTGYGFVDLDGTAEGLQNVIEAQRDWLRQWERPFSVEAEEYIPAGDVVVVLIRWHGTGEGQRRRARGRGRARVATARRRGGPLGRLPRPRQGARRRRGWAAGGG